MYFSSQIGREVEDGNNYIPNRRATSMCLSGQAAAVKLNTAGAVMTTDKP